MTFVRVARSVGLGSVVISVSLLVAGCGAADPPAASQPPESPESIVESSVAETSDLGVVPSDVPRPAADRLLLCEDVPKVTTDVIGSNLAGQNPDPIFVGVINTYAAEHPDTYGGKWIDRDAGGTFVVAFTDDPGPHLAELAARRPQPTDLVELVPPPPIIDDRPIGEWDQPFDVVQVEFTEAELLATLHNVARALGGTTDRFSSAGLDTDYNRVSVDLSEPTVNDLVSLAEIFPVDQVCVTGPLVDPDQQDEDRFEPGDEINVIVMPGRDGQVAADTPVTCDGTTTFPLSALDDAVPLTDSDLVEVRSALEQLLASETDVHSPQHGWLILSQSAQQVELIYADTETVGFMTFRRTTAGWAWAGGSVGGPCHLRSVLPAGLGDVEWELDPAFAPPDADTTVLHLLVTERQCASGRPMGGRLLGPQIVETDGAVLIAFAAITQDGNQDCQGNPSAPVTVELPTPLGDRQLRDGRTIATDITQLID